ncbi:MAG: hypothetical protein JST79_16390 [Acidobacteria bacterium]|jgi:hypothetical protein|nr:hypothetical protein [Acidobacteriota bacterium]
MTHLINIAIYAVEAMFALGIVGSMIVVLLTTIEDANEVFQKDEQPEPVGVSRQEHLTSVSL